MRTDRHADRCALLCLCTGLAMPPRADHAPMERDEWRALAARLSASRLPGPGRLLGLGEADVADALSLASAERPLAIRVASLVARAPQVAIEFERLESLGLWCVAQTDDPEQNPLPPAARLEAEPVLFGVGNRDLIRAKLGLVPPEGGAETLAALRACAEDGAAALSPVTLRTAGLLASGALETGAQLVLVADSGHLRLVREPSLRALALRGDAVLVGCGNPSGPAPAAVAPRQEALVRALCEGAEIGTPAQTQVKPAPEPSDAYALVLPLLRRVLASPRRVDEVARDLAILPAQAKAWLARAEAEGRVCRVGRRPVTYQAASASQPGLFDADAAP